MFGHIKMDHRLYNPIEHINKTSGQRRRDLTQPTNAYCIHVSYLHETPCNFTVRVCIKEMKILYDM